jgi:hypothetical protein
MLMPAIEIVEVCRRLTGLCWEVAKATSTDGGDTVAMQAARELHGVDWGVSTHSPIGARPRMSAGRARGMLNDYAEIVVEIEGLDSFVSRLWRELADAVDDVCALLDDDRNVNPDDVCRDPQAHLDYLDAALQIPIELIERWRQLVEDHPPAEALQKALREVGQ